MPTKRQKHRGAPKVDSIPSARTENGLEQRVVGKYALHPTKGWRKVTPVNMYAFINKIETFLRKLK